MGGDRRRAGGRRRVRWAPRRRPRPGRDRPRVGITTRAQAVGRRPRPDRVETAVPLTASSRCRSRPRSPPAAPPRHSRSRPPPRRRCPWPAGRCACSPRLVAYSRVHTGVHYPGDVVAGALVGSTTGGLVAALAARRRRQEGLEVAATSQSVTARARRRQLVAPRGDEVLHEVVAEVSPRDHALREPVARLGQRRGRRGTAPARTRDVAVAVGRRLDPVLDAVQAARQHGRRDQVGVGFATALALLRAHVASPSQIARRPTVRFSIAHVAVVADHIGLKALLRVMVGADSAVSLAIVVGTPPAKSRVDPRHAVRLASDGRRRAVARQAHVHMARVPARSGCGLAMKVGCQALRGDELLDPRLEQRGVVGGGHRGVIAQVDLGLAGADSGCTPRAEGSSARMASRMGPTTGSERAAPWTP